MGRKKRSAPSSNVDGYGNPVPAYNQGGAPAAASAPQRKKNRGGASETPDDPELTGEKYLVKKYRPDKYYAAMDAFVKYTKSHRMLDATYVRWQTGVTTEKPHVYSTRVGGTDLGWGRGKTREAAMDCACRAAFALVSAHGFNHFPVDDDCLTSKPMAFRPPPPPPPPPPPMPAGPPGMGMGLPPMPNGLPPPPISGLPPPPPPVMTQDLIPQAQVGATSAPVATSVSGAASTTPVSVVTPGLPPPPSGGAGGPPPLLPGAAPPAGVGISLDLKAAAAGGGAPPSQKKQLKGGLLLVFDGGEGPNEMSMEELRASLPRYQSMVARSNVSKAVTNLPCLAGN